MPITTIPDGSFGLISNSSLSLVSNGSDIGTVPSICFGTAYKNNRYSGNPGTTDPTEYNKMASLQAEDRGGYVCDLVFYTKLGSTSGWSAANSSASYERLKIPYGGSVSNAAAHITGICQATSGFNVSSSLKYKKDIIDLSGEYNLDMLMKYRPVVYNHIKDDENENSLPGLIAEEMDEIGAKLFVTYKDGEPDALDYSKLCVHLVKSIQEMKMDYDNKINKLQNVYDKLKERILLKKNNC
jgi:hypothetical protein